MSIKNDKDRSANEPIEYLAEFSYLKRSKIIAVFCGLGTVVIGIMLSNIFFRSLTISGGLIGLYYGFKELLETGAKLKLAKTGVWTKKLGFKPWSSIKIITIKINRYTPHNSIIDNSLNIYLMGNNTITPDQEFLFGPLKNNEMIKPMIDEICGKDVKCEMVIY